MKIIYDPNVDILRVRFNDATISESDENVTGVIIDYADDGSVVGFEILDASTRVHNPSTVELAVVAHAT